jgi:hypothetical protein
MRGAFPSQGGVGFRLLRWGDRVSDKLRLMSDWMMKFKTTYTTMINTIRPGPPSRRPRSVGGATPMRKPTLGMSLVTKARSPHSSGSGAGVREEDRVQGGDDETEDCGHDHVLPGAAREGLQGRDDRSRPPRKFDSLSGKSPASIAMKKQQDHKHEVGRDAQEALHKAGGRVHDLAGVERARDALELSRPTPRRLCPTSGPISADPCVPLDARSARRALSSEPPAAAASARSKGPATRSRTQSGRSGYRQR